MAQNVDLNCAMGGLGTVLRIDPADRSVPRALVYSFAGLLGFVGLNDAGLAIGINLVLAGRWTLGVSQYLLVRQLLRLRSLEECVNELARIPRSSSRAFLICDPSDMAAVELTVNELRVIRGEALYHARQQLSSPRLQAFARSNQRV